MCLLEPPRLLWKYRTWNQNAQSAVTNGTVYFSLIQELNDPNEGRCVRRFPVTDADVEQAAREICHQRFVGLQTDEFEREVAGAILGIQELREQHQGRVLEIPNYHHGIFCASETFNNLLMWAHYADEHRGVCLGIRVCSLPRIFRKMTYADDLPQIEFHEYLNPTWDSFVKVALTKSADWSYENEWRTVHVPGLLNVPNCVEKLIIGARASPIVCASIAEAVEASGREIEIHRATLDEVGYGITVRPEILL